MYVPVHKKMCQLILSDKAGRKFLLEFNVFFVNVSLRQACLLKQIFTLLFIFFSKLFTCFTTFNNCGGHPIWANKLSILVFFSKHDGLKKITIFEHLLKWYFISEPFVMLLFRIYQRVFLHHLHNQTNFFGRFDKTNSFIDVTISKWIFDIFLIFSFPMTKRGAFVFTDWGNWPLIALSAFSCSRNDCI